MGLKCLECKQETSNPKFCSCSCAATFNNKVNPKRKWLCKKCGNPSLRPSPYAVICGECKEVVKTKIENTTLGELRSKKWASRQIYACVRTSARKILQQEKRNICEKCKYDKHIEACHIKPISEFPDKTTVIEVNSNDNLLALCPNCHWELDNLNIE